MPEGSEVLRPIYPGESASLKFSLLFFRLLARRSAPISEFSFFS